jgi:hypothetical protein
MLAGIRGSRIHHIWLQSVKPDMNDYGGGRKTMDIVDK